MIYKWWSAGMHNLSTNLGATPNSWWQMWHEVP